MTDPPDIATLLAMVAADQDGSVVPPIVQTSLFSFDSYDDLLDRMTGDSDDPLYTRVQNPTVAAFETVMSELEGGEAAVGFASGMAAISSSLLAFLKPGDRVACVENVYPDTYRLMERLLRPFGVEIDYYSPDRLAREPDLLKGVALAYLESPSSAVFQTLDLAQLAGHAKRHGTLTIVDNSWATPMFQQPLHLGIDISLHSASKYISGHSDTVAGVVVSSQAHIARIRDLTLPLLGAKLAPFEAFLLLRGLRTLHARMLQHQATANLFVDRLASLPQIRCVHSPAAHEVPGLVGRSGLMSVEFDDKVDIRHFSDRLTHFRLGVSWGGFESLIFPIEIGLAQSGECNSMRKFGVSPNLVRLNLGLENAEDLWADFTAALTASIT